MFRSSSGLSGYFTKTDTVLQPNTQNKINDKKDEVPSSSQKDPK